MDFHGFNVLKEHFNLITKVLTNSNPPDKMCAVSGKCSCWNRGKPALSNPQGPVFFKAIIGIEY
jgi:hypothetical protein